MSRLKSFFISRTTIITLIVLALSAVTTGGIIPQAFITNQVDLDKWRLAHPLLSGIADLLGLHHIYTTPCFALILCGVLASLAISCLEQFRITRKRLRETAGSAQYADAFQSPLQLDEAAHCLRRYGFRPTGSEAHGLPLVKYSWGYWGNFLLHIGLLITISGSLLIALTQQRGLQVLTEGEAFQPGQPWRLSDKGLLASDLQLPGAVRLDKVNYSFWPNFGLRELASDITIITPEGTELSKTTRINSILFYRGLHIYQGSRYGHSFHIGFTDPDGRSQHTFLEIPHPIEPGLASYEDYPGLLGPEYQLRVKYMVNNGMKSFEPVNPVIVLRVDKAGQEIGRVSLGRGEEGSAGPFEFMYIDHANWSQLIFVKLPGIELVFFGFFIICLGGVLHYFVIPRVIMLRYAPEGGTEVNWRATRFAGFYRDELVTLKKALGCGENHG